MKEPSGNTTCETLRPLLLAHAVREIGEHDSRRVREHLETCASCRTESQALARQLNALTVLRDAAQPTEIVIAQLKNQARNESQSKASNTQDLQSSKRTPRRRWLPIAASFAVVCAIVFFILQLRINNIKINNDNNNKNHIETAENIGQNGQKRDVDKGNTVVKDNNDKRIKKSDKIVAHSLTGEIEMPQLTVTSDRGHGKQRIAGRKRAIRRHKFAGTVKRNRQEQTYSEAFEDRDPLQERILSLKAEVDDLDAAPSLVTSSSGWDDVDARLDSVDSGIEKLNKRMRDMSMRLELPPDQSKEG